VKIQTIKKLAEVIFEDGTRLQGFLFLSPASARRWGKESIGELLNGDRKSLPMELKTKEVVLLNRSAIVMAFSEEKEEEPILTEAKRIPVEVVLRSGETLSGEIHNDLPKTHSRLSDYLNRTDTFFRLQTGGMDCFVSNGFVRLIKPADPEEAHPAR
jgi:hypothetical protein